MIKVTVTQGKYVVAVKFYPEHESEAAAIESARIEFPGKKYKIRAETV